MWDKLTVDEALNLVAALKGVNKESRDRFKRVITQNLDLIPFKNTLCKNLSGGNKRNLCTAQAIMLCPKVLFLDEPTTGVDPVSPLPQPHGQEDVKLIGSLDHAQNGRG